MQPLEIDDSPGSGSHAHGGVKSGHTALDVGHEEVGGSTGHLQQEGYSRKERARQEKAGLLNGEVHSDSSHPGNGPSLHLPPQILPQSWTHLYLDAPQTFIKIGHISCLRSRPRYDIMRLEGLKIWILPRSHSSHRAMLSAVFCWVQSG